MNLQIDFHPPATAFPLLVILHCTLQMTPTATPAASSSDTADSDASSTVLAAGADSEDSTDDDDDDDEDDGGDDSSSSDDDDDDGDDDDDDDEDDEDEEEEDAPPSRWCVRCSEGGPGPACTPEGRTPPSSGPERNHRIMKKIEYILNFCSTISYFSYTVYLQDYKKGERPSLPPPS